MPAAGKKTVEDIDVHGKRVLVRVDFNVPMKRGTTEISDDSRIRAALSTIEYLRDREAVVILCSHFGRPGGKVVQEMQLEPVQERLEELLDDRVLDAEGPGAPRPAELTSALVPGDIALLENLRFDPREEQNDDGFAQELASLADVYVNDAFGAAHRAHASTHAVTRHLPAVAGFLMARELAMLSKALESEDRPVVAAIGGAKVSDKIQLLGNLSDRVDSILVGGGMVAAFLAARGYTSGASVEQQDLDAARQLLEASGARIILPDDVVVAEALAEDAAPQVVACESVPEGSLVLDIGPAARDAYAREISAARVFLWNGPMGVFEWASFAEGTTAVAMAAADNPEALTIVGGGSTAEAVAALGLADRMTHVSTGGGASLEFLEGKELPGVAALMDA